MKFGIATFVNDDSIDPVSLARAVEERGFESLGSQSTLTFRPAANHRLRAVASCRSTTTGHSTRSSRWPRRQP
ncbi:MAG: hypothetical protein QOE48_2385 [Mycobacterium sp.]|nr:hypothetical protein [Mycobacterium sp.]